jgi:hypothetical protein
VAKAGGSIYSEWVRWLVIIAPGPIDESGSQRLIANLPPDARPVFTGVDLTQLSTVQLTVEASLDAEARALGLEIFNDAAEAAALSLQPRIQSVVKARAGR